MPKSCVMWISFQFQKIEVFLRGEWGDNLASVIT